MTYQQKWLYKKVNIAIHLRKKHFEIDLHLLIPPKKSGILANLTTHYNTVSFFKQFLN